MPKLRKTVGLLLTASALAAGGVAAPARAEFTLEVRAISTDVGTISPDQKLVDIPNSHAANILMGIYMHHTLDSAPASDPFQFGLGAFNVSVTSTNDQINGVPLVPATPAAAVGNVTASLLHGGPNDPDAPFNGGSGFGLSPRFNQFDTTTFGDGQNVSLEGGADGDIDLLGMNATQNIHAAPVRFLSYYGASKTPGVGVDTLLGTFTFTTNPYGPVDVASTQLQIYLPNSLGTDNSAIIRSLTGSSTALGGGGVSLGPLFLTAANLGAPVTVEVNLPEPSSIGLLGIGGIALLRGRRHR